MDLSKTLLTLVGFLVPPDPLATDFVGSGDAQQLQKAEKAMQELRLWRWKVSVMLFLLTGTGLWMAAFSGFVRADEVNKRVEEALTPVQQKLDEVSIRMAALSTSHLSLEKAINNQLAVATVDNICKLISRRAKETDPHEVNSLRRDIDALQALYRQYMGVDFDYPESRCEK